MAGAPQGPVYQVAVLETGDFEPSPNPDEEMQAVRAASAGDGDWADLYSAVDSARRLCIFHAQKVLVPGGRGAGGSGEGGDADGNLEGVVGLLAAAVGNLRSSMVRNALLGVGDIFRRVCGEFALVGCVSTLLPMGLHHEASGERKPRQIRLR